MRLRSKALKCVAAAILLFQVILPTSFADNEPIVVDPVEETAETVDPAEEATPGEEVPEEGAETIAAAPTASVITDNLITAIEMKDEDGNRIQDIRPDQGSRVELQFLWTLPADHGYGAGSTYTFQLPDKFRADRLLEGELDGEIGTYVITPDGQVTFTFNQEIEDNLELNGDFHVWRQFDAGKFSGGTKQDIVYDFAGITIPVHFKSSGGKELDKTGTANKGMNPSRIDWTVEFNKGEKSIQNAIFKDKLPAGLALDTSSVKVYLLEVQLNGSTSKGEQLADPADYQLRQVADGFELELGDIEDAYRVEYATNITGTVDATYRNEATVRGTNLSTPQTGNDSIQARYSKPIEKLANYDRFTQSVKWTIRYNYNEQSIEPADAWVKDTFDTAKHALDTGSFTVYKMTIADNGSASRTGAALEYGTDYTVAPDSDGFTLNFTKKIDSAYEISYTTKSINRIYDDKQSMTNEVEMIGSKTASESVSFRQVIFSKGSGAVNYKNKTIEWQLTLNEDLKTMDAVVIKDQFTNQGMTFLPSSIAISGLTKETDYTVTPDASNESIVIDFKKTITGKHVITYKTAFDPTFYTPAQIKSARYQNNASLEWEESGVKQTAIAKSASVNPDNYTKNNGSKTGEYDARTKEITWTIDMNYNLHSISQPVVRDFYTGEQTLDVGSITVQQLTLNGGNNSVTPGSALTAGTDYTVTPQKSDGKDGFELTFAQPIDSAYRITYKTSLMNHPVTSQYVNEAVVFDAAVPSVMLFSQSDTVNPLHGDEYVMKLGSQGTGADQDFAFWTIWIDRSQSHMEAGSVLKDTLSSNQVLVTDSFKLYTTIADKQGNLTKGAPVPEAAYELQVAGNTFSLTFKQSFDAAYVLEYKSFINAGDGETIGNDASFAGQSSGSINEKESSSFQASFSGAGGGASGSKGSFKIVKVDAADSITPLAGAKFGLYDASGTNLLKELVTDSKGIALFENYKYRDYVLKELAAPSGYLISTEYKDGQKVTLDTAVKEVKVANQKGIWDLELLKVDRDNPSKTLSNATFALQFLNGATFEDVDGMDELRTNSQGIISLTDLPLGDYQLIETKAPRGYKLDKTPVPFTIFAEQAAAVKVTATNEANRGDVVLTKVDAYDNAPLAGAIFDLVAADDTPVKSGLVTDADGKIEVEDLPAGTYRFIETAAPAGYYLLNDPLEFELVDEDLLEFTIANNAYRGDLKVVKVDSDDSTKLLEGAQFGLYDASGTTLLKELVTGKDGTAVFKNYKYGDYVLKELVAPSGYLIPTEYMDGQIVTLGAAAKEIKIANQKGVWDLELLKVDRDNPSKTLSNATFALQFKNGATFENVDGMGELTTNSQGKIYLADLPPGDYQLIETKAPRGYQLDKTPIPFTIHAYQATATQVTATNEINRGDVVLTKIDELDKVSLPGATFDLETAAGAKVETALITDAEGKIKVTNLPAGSYRFVETAAPAGYHLQTKPFEFELVDEELLEFTFANAAFRGDLKVVKVDSDDSSKLLDGAKFGLYDASGTTLLEELTTGIDGIATFENYKYGDYMLKELVAPSGYLIPTEYMDGQKVTLGAGVKEIKIANQKGVWDLELLKVDKDNPSKTLSNATFALQFKNGATFENVDGMGELITDSKGKIYLADLPPGDYQLIETKAPRGYQLDKTPIPFTIHAYQASATQVTATNEINRGDVVLTKIDVYDKALLPGATFDLETAAGAKVETGLITDAKGKIKVTNLPAGSYRFVETAAPAGYHLQTKPFEFELVDEELLEFTFANAAFRGDLKVVKVDSDDSSKLLDGAKFGLYDASGTTLLEELTTGIDGIATFENYKYGDYMLKELVAPSGYLIPTEYMDGQKVTLGAGVKEIKIANQKGVWDLELLKVDKENPSKTLSNATFALQFKNGATFENVDGMGELTTDSKGKIYLAGLPHGDYQLIETKAPRGYKLDKTPIPFTIYAYQATATQVTATNEINRGDVVLTKVDRHHNTPLPGATFDLVTAAGAPVKTGLITDADGKIKVENLAAGVYRFIETAAPAGYDLRIDSLEFELVDEQLLEFKFANSKTNGSVKVVAIAGCRPDRPLKDAEFVVLDENKQPIKDNNGKEIIAITGDDGTVRVTELLPGNYFIKQIKAPRGYALIEDILSFEVVGGEEAEVTACYNYLSVNIPDEESPSGGEPGDTDEPGSGEPGNSGETGNSGEEGNGSTPGPGPTDNPDQPDGDPTGETEPGHQGESDNGNGQVGNEDDGNSAGGGNGQVAGENDGNEGVKGVEVLPKTGEDSTLPFTLSGMALILLGAALLLYRKKRNVSQS
ncbi:LPXTG cell wall anchor domain-containing protein [Paenibacillus sp. 1011MAR3C5]|uniref:SpaA isopeptide-forming pilin-related protein n=1 Tax=Paenibacillus sp. 1011MAR3C5 TaxID=1675787 RepID=UPI000E6BE88C|nr:SpaA isopeptide-forming pilin-related protein [Paenibacillus sp. 1011MAR3C5]RJE87477.1 LPXTG cell wall anchor domain-containing protein [Paenibacillus sp. 1011MAR3C5]